ncbi:MAG: hypothetical protein ABI216_21830 [Devosia sp.]
MSYTKGKLTAGRCGSICAGEFHQYRNAKAQRQFASVSWPHEYQAEGGVTQEENTHRLVACWNALLPFTTEQIEAGIDLVALVKETDDLRKAAIELLVHLSDPPHGAPAYEYVKALRDAIEETK